MAVDPVSDKPTPEGVAPPAEHDEVSMAHAAILAEERSLSKIQCIKRHPAAFFWAIFAAFQVLLVSYENQAAGMAVGIPRFREDFGSEYNGNYVLDPAWQGAFSAGPVGSQVIGALISGQIGDWLGRQKTIMLALAISFVSITLEVIATTNEMFFGGKFLNGFAVGTLKAVSATYIGEVAPIPIRGLATCFIGLSYTIGPLIVALIVTGTGELDSRWAYRAVFASQYGVAAISASLIWFMPESPWWLIRKGKDEQALRSVRRLGYTEETAESIMIDIRVTLEHFLQETAGVTYLECFRGSNLRRTMISIAPLSIQAFSGALFGTSYFTYFAQLAGYSAQMSFRLSIVQQIMSMVGNIISWQLVDRVGRRDLIFYGTAALVVVLSLMGGLATEGSASFLRGAVAMNLMYSLVYNIGIGAVAFTILAETATSRLRMKTIAIGLATQNSVYLGWSFALPYLFNPDRLNLGGKVGFIFAGTTVVCLVYLWFCQPETRDRSFYELDEMFNLGLKARDFKTYQTTTGMQTQEARDMEKTG